MGGERGDLLQSLYPTLDDIEFYPGLFSKDRVAKSPLPGLLLCMVGIDAFSQALTNPLLSEHVFNEATFTAWGLQLILDTHSLARSCCGRVRRWIRRPSP